MLSIILMCDLQPVPFCSAVNPPGDMTHSGKLPLMVSHLKATWLLFFFSNQQTIWFIVIDLKLKNSNITSIPVTIQFNKSRLYEPILHCFRILRKGWFGGVVGFQVQAQVFISNLVFVRRTEEEIHSLSYDWLAVIFFSKDYNKFYIIHLVKNVCHDNYILFSKNTLSTELL